MFHDVEDNFASVALSKSVGVDKFAVIENVCEGDSWRHLVSNDFENAPNQVAFNNNYEWRIVLVGNIAKSGGRADKLFFSASDGYERTLVGKFDKRCSLTVDNDVIENFAGQDG